MPNPKITALGRDAAWKVKQMYEERDEKGRRLYTTQELADLFGVGETTIWRAIRRVGPYANLPEVKLMNADAEESLKRFAAENPDLVPQKAPAAPPSLLDGGDSPDDTAGTGVNHLQHVKTTTLGDVMLDELNKGDEKK